MSQQKRKLPELNTDTLTRHSGLSDRMHSAQLSGLERYDEYAKTANEPSLKKLTAEHLGGNNAHELIV